MRSGFTAVIFRIYFANICNPVPGSSLPLVALDVVGSGSPP